jgi:hypothetical protein
VEHEVIQNEKADDKDAEPDGDDVGHSGKLGQVVPRCKSP